MDYTAALVRENERFGELVRDADPAVQVPTCPGWSLVQLTRHLGRGHRWAAQIISDRETGYLDPRAVRDGKPPKEPDAAAAWLRGSAQAVVDAVSEAGPDTPVWTFLGPRPAEWWIRRRLHEATVHRADAALALDADYELSADLAADAISEWLDIVTAQRGSAVLTPGSAVHLSAVDAPVGSSGDWLILGEADGVSWSHSADGADVTLRGSTLHLLLALVRRRSVAAGGIEVSGAEAVWSEWLDHTPF
ncbi:maleylpyruvate isomerase family mycothiol-dependent enzyme [Pseudonocardia spinosispora]|uniref:maleylpyruvate isomerase family mycothiol-dependent enzyme n=1 Tax=Pseudonocardia spinosispora TaxID=103441 RepID=UPI00048AFBF4|nr:maleylpyruvate isomerase family mycothiol-dependent enzyme [Pseudonocardia spinosispora]